MKTIVALPGQGIGIEVVDATCEIMTAAGMPLKILTPPQGEGSNTVPEETRRTMSIDGSSRHSVSAIVISSSVGAPNDRPSRAVSCTARTVSGCAWPRIAGPHEPT